MAAVASGEIKKPGLSPEKAKEFLVRGGEYKRLPEHKKPSFNKTRKMLGKMK